MDAILVVDRDLENLKKIRIGFQKLKPLQLLTAGEAKTAVDVLRNKEVDVFVSGMNLSDFDGVEMMAYLSRNYSAIPCIAMLEPGQRRPWFTESTGHEHILYFIEKPFRFESLAEMIISAKNLKDSGRTSKGMSLKNFLPLIESTGKTCQVGVKSGKKQKGDLFFIKGGLIDARWENMIGEAAVMEMLEWDGVKVSISRLPISKKEGRVEVALMDKIGVSWEKPEKPQGLSFPRPGGAPLPDSADLSRLVAALKRYAGVLKSIKGYIGLAVLNPDGKVLAADFAEESVDFEKFSAGFISILNQCNQVSGQKGLKKCTGVTVHTQEAMLILVASDIYTQGNYRFMGMMAPDGNGFFMKLQMENIMGQILKE